jgi:hypothetical protein
MILWADASPPEASTAALIAAIAGVAGLLISTGGAVAIAWIAYKTKQLGNQVEVVHRATNSLAQKMGEAMKAQGTAEGTAEGLRQGRAEPRPGDECKFQG